MPALTRDILLTAIPPKVKAVQLKELGLTAYVRTISALEKDRFESRAAEAKAAGAPLDNFRARIVALCCCDEEGKPLYTDEDIPALGAQPAYVIEPIAVAATKLNGWTAADVAALGKD